VSIINFTVNYDLFGSETDSADAGADADIVALIGDVTFTPVTSDDKPVQAPGYAPRPAGFKLRKFVGYLDSDGRLKSSRNGAVGVRLWANDPVFDLDQLTYRVDFDLRTPIGDKVSVDGGYFVAPSTDGTINLANVLTSTGSAAVGSGGGGDSSVYASEIVDSTSVGRALMTAANAAAARSAIGVDIGDVYNWRSDNTRNVHRSIAKAVAGQSASHLIIGDSTSALYTGATTYAAMWPRLLGQYLNARGIPLAGTGWVSPANAENSLAKDPRFTFTGTWLQTGVPQGYLYSSTNGSSVTFTSDLPGTIVEVAYGAVSGAFTVSIDGANPVTVTPSGVGSATPSKYTVTGLLDTTHTVTVTLSTATLTQIFFFNVYKTTGLQIHNLALSGMTANAWVTEASGSRSQAVNRLGLSPDVVHIALGVNDLNYSATLGGTGSATATRIQTIMNSWPNADIILYGQLATSPSASVPTPPSNSTWSAYIDLLYGIADNRNVPLVDLYKRSGGSYSSANTNALMGDSIHPNKTAQADWALLVTNLLTARAA
jgi:lysophospholipase L1-like esterase